MYFHSCISIRGCALFSLWNSPHHGRHKTVENKGSNVRYNKINITFPAWVIVDNIIPRNMIINLGCAWVDNHIPRDDIFDYQPIRECNIYIIPEQKNDVSKALCKRVSQWLTLLVMICPSVLLSSRNPIFSKREIQHAFLNNKLFKMRVIVSPLF